MPSSSSMGSDEISPGPSPLILIVDNDRDNLLLAKYIIESMGINCVTIEDSQQCLATIEELVPDLILLDIVMPNLNGIEIVEQIRGNLTTAEIKVIAVTGLTKVEDRDLLVEAGFDDYLCKPYFIEELVNKLNLYL